MALPATYEFARDAWFLGIGTLGKTLGDIAVVPPANAKGLDRMRENLRRHISARLPSSSTATHYMLRDRAGDYVRRLLAEASGYGSDRDILDNEPASDCSRDACVALLRKGMSEWRLLATRSAYHIAWEKHYERLLSGGYRNCRSPAAEKLGAAAAQARTVALARTGVQSI